MFSYCLNNPVNKSDLLGYISYDAIDEDPNNDDNPLNDIARMGNGRPTSPVRVGKGLLRGVDVHSFKFDILNSSGSNMDIFRDIANNSILWLGNKAQTIWIETGYYLEDLFELYPK